MLGYPVDRAAALLAAQGVQAEIRVIARGGAPADGVLRVVRQRGAVLTAAVFLCGEPAPKE